MKSSLLKYTQRKINSNLTIFLLEIWVFPIRELVFVSRGFFLLVVTLLFSILLIVANEAKAWSGYLESRVKLESVHGLITLFWKAATTWLCDDVCIRKASIYEKVKNMVASVVNALSTVLMHHLMTLSSENWNKK